MLAAAQKIAQYTAGLAFSDFAADPKTIDAVVRNLSTIGEAARHIPESVDPLGGHPRHAASNYSRVRSG